MDPLASILSENPVLLAPMAGVTEAPFRAICKRMGAGLTYTEMVSAKGLHYNPDSGGSRALLTFAPEEVPCAVQLFGADPAMMAAQAARIAELHPGQVAAIDVNMGCPVAKVVGKGEGSALMRDPDLAERIVRAIVEACPLPVSVKFRAGWDDATRNAVEFARRMEAAGVSAMAVHGRTREQFYHGRADWSVIEDVKRAVTVPVIGSGDVLSADDVVAMLERTGADAVMVARGAQGDPWIFREAHALLRGERLPRPTVEERVAMAREHTAALVTFAGERAFVRMRKHVAWYLTDMPGATHVRAAVNTARDHHELNAMLDEYVAYLEQR